MKIFPISLISVNFVDFWFRKSKQQRILHKKKKIYEKKHRSFVVERRFLFGDETRALIAYRYKFCRSAQFWLSYAYFYKHDVPTIMVKLHWEWCKPLNPLSANPTKWSNLNCSSVFDHFVGLALKGLNSKKKSPKHSVKFQQVHMMDLIFLEKKNQKKCRMINRFGSRFASGIVSKNHF